jgi:hypothetical protein
MTLDIVSAMAGLLVLAASSWLLLVQWDAPAAEKAGVAFGLGACLLGWEMLIFQCVGISFTLPHLLIPLLSLQLGLGLWIGRLQGQSSRVLAIKRSRLPFSRREWMGFSAILFLGAYALFQATLRPMEAWDSVAIWGVRGKAIYLARSIPVEAFTKADSQLFHHDYPFLLPLLQGYVYQWMPRFNDFAVKVIGPLFLFACLLLFFGMLRQLPLSRGRCLLYTFLLASLPELSVQASNGYADILICFYFSGSLLLLLQWMKKRTLAPLVLSALFGGAAALTKNEGLMLGLINCVILALYLFCSELRTRWKTFLLYAAVLSCVELPWLILRQRYALASDFLNAQSLDAAFHWERLARLGPILYQYQSNWFRLDHWNILWPLLFVVLAANFRRCFRSESGYVLLGVGLALAGYSMIYLITPLEIHWHLSTSANRLFLHFVPLVVYFIALQDATSSQPLS